MSEKKTLSRRTGGKDAKEAPAEKVKEAPAKEVDATPVEPVKEEAKPVEKTKEEPAPAEQVQEAPARREGATLINLSGDPVYVPAPGVTALIKNGWERAE